MTHRNLRKRKEKNQASSLLNHITSPWIIFIGGWLCSYYRWTVADFRTKIKLQHNVLGIPQDDEEWRGKKTMSIFMWYQFIYFMSISQSILKIGANHDVILYSWSKISTSSFRNIQYLFLLPECISLNTVPWTTVIMIHWQYWIFP